MTNTAEDVAGKAKETTGRVRGNEELQAQGQTQQATSDHKRAGEKV